ncbi:MAG TPA: helix-turn-helix domain-containing protein [Enteractinococcus helveticum]|uniref:Helix-turn-helix domain-containing protein n=1 Tax=Enteractinococcus helveticum TaxID=1837282 RepID=A0A921FP70_9MICC|nr:helix-turn-helix transcriptional regulator [Enteractinococcus helveticum]HJF15166.1 helix-turn-helix domain-containing protein [Enteractinococcus helveticum]
MYKNHNEVIELSKKFSDLASRARETWSDDAQKIYDAASQVFQAEVAAQVKLGRDLASARRGHAMTQAQLADATGVPQAEISRIENGNANLTIEAISRLATALDKRFVLQWHPTVEP